MVQVCEVYLHLAWQCGGVCNGNDTYVHMYVCCVVLCMQSTTPSPVKYQKIETLAKVDAYKPFGSAQPRFVAGAEVSSHVGQAGLRLALLACLPVCLLGCKD